MKLFSASRNTLQRACYLALLGFAMLPAEAQDPMKAVPGSFKVALENDKVRVLEFSSRPGMGACGQGLHSHPAHLTVLLTAGKVRVKVGGKAMEESQPLGTVFWSEAETHEVENISGRNMRVLLVELKGRGTAADAAAALTR